MNDSDLDRKLLDNLIGIADQDEDGFINQQEFVLFI